MSGVHVAGTFWDNKTVAVVITGQLLPMSPQPAPPSDANGANGSQPQSRVACRVTVKSTSSELMLYIENARGTWLSEISQGALMEGLSSQSTHLANGSSHVHAAVAPLKAAYSIQQSAKTSPSEDNGTADEDATTANIFEDVLAQEWRRLQAVTV